MEGVRCHCYEAHQDLASLTVTLFSLPNRLCKIADITHFIKNPSEPFKINIMCHDKECYIFVLALCQHHSYAMLYQNLTSPESSYAIRRLSEAESRQKLLMFTSSTMLVIDEEAPTEEECGKIVFSLKDSTTKKLMVTPVRGKYCAHFQVRNFYCSFWVRSHILSELIYIIYPCGG